ncbi:MAG: hypothetical protein LBJ47_04395 [Tannerella sp.]|jgi:hypothetical protein|nr:hypothetical protein [Tannerella sp.]
MRKFILFSCCAALFCGVCAQKKNFDYSFYGFVRGDLYYNSRSNVEVVDGLFYLYPRDVRPDSDGKDLNATPASSFYSFTTRLGVNMKGPDVGAAKTSANIESDFGGTTDINFMLRLRRAYVKLDWDGGSSLLLGQTWHPLFGEVVPDVLNLATGAPFQPFNRSPQIRYQFRKNTLTLTTAAIYQLVYTSTGFNGKSEQYLKDGVLPELYLGADCKRGGFLVGAGIDMISLKPRLGVIREDGQMFRVNERVTSLSYDLHAGYTGANLRVSGKTVLASNQTHNVMLGGFGVTEIDSRTGEQKYTPFRHSTSWLNVVYGQKYQAALFAGYTKNLGTSERLVGTDKLYGMGLDIDRFTNLSLSLRYVLPHWFVGVGYTLATAWYGTTVLSDGKVTDTHDVTNHRIESVFTYFF